MGVKSIYEHAHAIRIGLNNVRVQEQRIDVEMRELTFDSPQTCVNHLDARL